jgi:hypothetical protein
VRGKACRLILALGVALMAAACPSLKSNPTPSVRPSSPRVLPTSPNPVPPVDPLCRHPQPSGAPPASPRALPDAISNVADQVEQVRRLAFVRPVIPESVTQPEIAKLLQSGLKQSFPPEMMDRREKAWQTIGVIPKEADLFESVVDLQSSQVIGFYDTFTHQLVFIGSDDPTPYQRMTLSHELTHALDDQRFDLGRLDVLQNSCRDEALFAFSALAEGDAVETSVRWAQQFLTPEEIQQLLQEQATFPPPPPSVPPFVRNLFIFPYPNGQRFVRALLARGGQAAVNSAFRRLPASTEQILHPEKYPNDPPTAVAVPDLASRLGQGWTAVDFEDVGEGWLRTMLALRLSEGEADRGADGWDGGQYRAWWDGTDTAVWLETVWDSPPQAAQFARTVRTWLGGQPALVRPDGSMVMVLFGSDADTMKLLQNAVGA